MSDTIAVRAPERAVRPRSPFDRWQTIAYAVFMTLVGYSVMVGVPVLTTAWVGQLGFTEAQGGRVAGADLGGLALGSVLSSLVMARWNRRWLVVLGVAIAILANGLCMVVTAYEPTLWLRVLAGVGSGVVTAVGVATLGGSSRPARAFNVMLFAFAFSQAAEMKVLPMLSMNGIYLLFIGCFLLCLPLLHYIPTSPLPGERRSEKEVAAASRLPRYLPWVCLAAIFFTYINIGTYWVYIELASLDAGIDGDWVGNLLVWVSFGSLVGCLFATLLSNRFGLARPLLVTLVIMTAIVGILVIEINYVHLFISLALFNLLWIFIDVYQMGTVSVIDRSGAFASLMPGAQGLGQIVGPYIAAAMLSAGMGYTPIFALCATAAFIGGLIYLAMYLGVRREVPQLVKDCDTD